MPTTYVSKKKQRQNIEINPAVSIIDKSLQVESLQRKVDMANKAAQRVEPTRPNNTGMPDNLKTGIESLSGFSMDDVRVHYNSSKPATVQALAYTQGTDIHVAPGQEKYLPHEAWHVAQQMAGRVSPTTNINGMLVNDNVALEYEADVMGEKAVTQRAISQRVDKAHLNFDVAQRLVIKYGDFTDKVIDDSAKNLAEEQDKRRVSHQKIDVQSFEDVEQNVLKSEISDKMDNIEKIYIVSHGCAALGDKSAVLEKMGQKGVEEKNATNVAYVINNVKAGLDSCTPPKTIGPIKIEACMSSLSRKTKFGFWHGKKNSLVQDVKKMIGKEFIVTGNNGLASGSEFDTNGVQNTDPQTTEICLLCKITCDEIDSMISDDYDPIHSKAKRQDGLNIMRHNKNFIKSLSINYHLYDEILKLRNLTIEDFLSLLKNFLKKPQSFIEYERDKIYEILSHLRSKIEKEDT